jgi:YQGE family putative transporter
VKFSGKSLGLAPFALTAIGLAGLFTAAESFCSAFVGVYLYSSNHDIVPVLKHYLALYGSVPITFVLAGWYAQSRDKMHPYRLGLLLNIGYYAMLLYLRDDAPKYAWQLGAWLGLTWGVFYAGSNTLHFDVSSFGRRAYYLGLVTSVNGFFQLVAPLISGAVIWLSPDRFQGYKIVFGLAIAVYCTCFLISLRLPKERTGAPFKMRHVMFPSAVKRDWRIAMTTGVGQLGIDVVVTILMPLLMFMVTNNEMKVGGFQSFQAMAGVIVAWLVGKMMNSNVRGRFLFTGAGLTLIAAIILYSNVTVWTLIAFGFLRAIGEPMFAIPQAALRWDIIFKSIEVPSERVAYLCAFEVCLGVGRVLAMGPIVILAYLVKPEHAYMVLAGSILFLCLARWACLALLYKTDEMKVVH